MERYLLIAIAVAFIGIILKASGVNKLMFYFAGILLIPAHLPILPFGNMTFPRIAVYSMIISLLLQKGWILNLKKFPLRIQLIILFLALLSCGMADERLEIAMKIYRPVDYFLSSFFPLFLTFNLLKSPDDCKKVYAFISKLFILFVLYGFSNFLIRNNEYNAHLSKIYGLRDFANAYTIAGESRFRVASLSWHSIFYGFLLQTIILLLIYLITTYKDFSKKIIYYFLFIGLIVNLFLVNSRTPLFALIPGIVMYITFSVSFSRQILIAFATVIIGAAVVVALPQAKLIVDKSLAVVTGSKKIKEDGSSVEMRQRQLNASMRVFNQSPIFGNGFGYIQDKLGFSSEATKKRDEFGGFESYAFLLLIEHGSLVIVANIIFFSSLIIWLIAQHGKVILQGKRTVFLSLSTLVSFLIFILGTGDLGSFIFFMSLMGVNLRLIMFYNKDNEIRFEVSEFQKILNSIEANPASGDKK